LNYYSHGKLLLSGEYLVLNAALALAVPVKFGQHIQLDHGFKEDKIIWETYMNDNQILNAEIDSKTLNVLYTSNKSHSDFVAGLLEHAIEINTGFNELLSTSKIIAKLNYNIEWGLGSSASLISNIAYLADINPYELHWSVSKGSGYDIACARSDKPLLYRLENKKPEVEFLDFKPSFYDNLFFIYTGRKQSSDESVMQYLKSSNVSAKDIETVSAISLNIIDSNDLDEFEGCIREHEAIISAVLKKKTIKEEKYDDFEGEIKSLGAWGGDFIMVTCKDGKEKVADYFHRKEMDIIFEYDQLLLS